MRTIRQPVILKEAKDLKMRQRRDAQSASCTPVVHPGSAESEVQDALCASLRYVVVIPAPPSRSDVPGLRMTICALVLCIAAYPTLASDTVVRALSGGTVIVARGDDRRIEGWDGGAGRALRVPTRRLWSVEGPAAPRLAVASPDGRVAVIDSLASRVTIVRERRSTTHDVGETPVAALFAGETLFLLCRDSARLERIDESGERTSVATAASPAFMARSGERILTYSPIDGTVGEFALSPLRRLRSKKLTPFASDFVAGGKHGYLAIPSTGQVIVISLERLEESERISIGAVPVDLELEGSRGAVSAGTIAVADPSSKRIWRTEGGQSETEAFARGFLRGVIGLGLYRPRSSEFPTGVDRLLSVGRVRLAYDSSGRRLYQVLARGARLIAEDLGPAEFDLEGAELFFWSATTGKLTRLELR